VVELAEWSPTRLLAVGQLAVGYSAVYRLAAALSSRLSDHSGRPPAHPR